MRQCAAIALVALLVAACDPKFGTEPGQFGSGGDLFGGGTDGGDDTGGPGGPDPIEPIVMISHFAVSSSAVNPLLNSGTVPAGPVDLYLWLIDSSHPVSAMEFDIRRDGAELADTYFTAAGVNLWLTWEGSGEVDVTVAPCAQMGQIIGTIHLVADGGPLTVSAIRNSEHAGAVDCEQFLVHPFECIPFVGNEEALP